MRMYAALIIFTDGRRFSGVLNARSYGAARALILSTAGASRISSIDLTCL